MAVGAYCAFARNTPNAAALTLADRMSKASATEVTLPGVDRRSHAVSSTLEDSYHAETTPTLESSPELWLGPPSTGLAGAGAGSAGFASDSSEAPRGEQAAQHPGRTKLGTPEERGPELTSEAGLQRTAARRSGRIAAAAGARQTSSPSAPMQEALWTGETTGTSTTTHESTKAAEKSDARDEVDARATSLAAPGGPPVERAPTSEPAAGLHQDRGGAFRSSAIAATYSLARVAAPLGYEQDMSQDREDRETRAQLLLLRFQRS